MNGKINCGLRNADCGVSRRSARRNGFWFSTPQSAFRNPQSKGFTLLELIIVISIIVILALVVLPRYQNAVLHAKEATLKSDLLEMRKSLDQYAADKGQLPSSLEDLSPAYIRDVPIDPITGQKDWNVERGDDPNLKANTQGVKNVHSSSSETSSEGTPYNEW